MGGRAAAAVLFVGRTGEQHALRDLVADMRIEGRGHVALVEGEAGIGKTRLLDEVLAWAASRHIHALRAECHELETDRPFGVLADALDLRPDSDDPERAELGGLIGEGAAAPGDLAPPAQAPELRFRVVEAIMSLLEQLSLSRPIVLALEDLHWADPSSLLVLERLSRRIREFRLALLVTRRPLPRPRALELLVAAADEQGLHVALEPLERAEVAELAAGLVGERPGEGLLDTLGRAGGNPLFIEELLAALKREDAIVVAGGRADVAHVAFPRSLRLTILRRLGFLSDSALDVLRTASVLGSSFSASDLATVLGRPGSDLVHLLTEPVQAGLLTGEEDRLSFRHDVVREAIYEDLTPALRRALHVDAGRALAASGAPARRVATHLALGASRGDAEAVEWLLRAAREVASRAPAVAVGFLQRARELAADDDDRRPALDVELVRSLLWSGRLADAEDLGRELLATHPEPELAGALGYALGRALVYSGRLAESIAAVEKALAEPRLPEAQRGRLLADLSLRRCARLDLRDAEAAATEARRLGERLGDDLVISTAYCGSSWAAILSGRFDNAVEDARAARAHAERRVTEAVQRVQARLYLVRALLAADALDEAAHVLEDGRRLAKELGTEWALPLLATLAGLHAYLSGAWDDAVAEAQTSLALADELGASVWVGFSSGVLALVLVQRDELRRAEALLDSAERELAPGRPRADLERLLLARALLLEITGDSSGALAALEHAWDLNAEGGGVGEYRELGPELVRLAVAEGALDRARSVALAVEEAAASATLESARRAALRCRGLLEHDAGVLEEAASVDSGESRPLERACASLEAGVALAEAGRKGEAASRLRDALDLFEQLGAVRQVARAEFELRRVGVRRGARGGRGRPLSGWASLTQSERKVAALVAEGLTNPQIAERLFVSRRTVETHVSHILAKLELPSRVRLAAEAARRAEDEAAP